MNKLLEALKGLQEKLKGLSPRNKMLAGVGAGVLVLLIAVGAYFAMSPAPPPPEPVKVQAPPPPPPPPTPEPEPEPEPEPVVEIPPPPPLPSLEESDKLVQDSLAELIGSKSLVQMLHADRLIRNIVATVDNLPGRDVSRRVLPVRPPYGKFLVAGGEDNWTISARNAVRYRAYVKLAEAMDTVKLVELYVRLYPLFQDAYAELGYPKKYFNDRLLVVLDDLLAAPDVKEPVKLLRPKVFYLYADPDQEARSIGQRIMMRMGSKNEAAIKARLNAFKQELMLHMADGKVAYAGMPASWVAATTTMAQSGVKEMPAAAE